MSEVIKPAEKLRQHMERVAPTLSRESRLVLALEAAWSYIDWLELEPGDEALGRMKAYAAHLHQAALQEVK